MNAIWINIRQYWSGSNKIVFWSVTVFTAVLIALNYTLGIDHYISNQQNIIHRIGLRYFLHLLAFLGPYVLLAGNGSVSLNNRSFLVLLFSAPLIFAIKMSFPQGHYGTAIFWQQVMYWPTLLLVVTGLLYFLSLLLRSRTVYFQFPASTALRPYLMLLLMMVPLVIFATSQDQFREVYPKLFNMDNGSAIDLPHWLKSLLYELAYGSDFITIELFFRGFLILAFVKWAGKHSILPMAVFYCVIHFGKPPLECISSYFGGMILGVIVYHSKSIAGGLIVHLGVAWMMELAGYIAHIWKK